MGKEDARDRFYALAWPHAEAVLRTARFLVRDPGEADDLAQETMIKAFRSLDSFSDGTNILAWLMKILRNTHIDHLRGTKRLQGTISLDQLGAELADGRGSAVTDLSSSTDPEQILESFSDAEVIRALQQLPDDIRWTLLLVEVEQLNHEEAAKVLEVPVGTVKSRAFRGRSMLRETLIPAARDRRMIAEKATNDAHKDVSP